MITNLSYLGEEKSPPQTNHGSTIQIYEVKTKIIKTCLREFAIRNNVSHETYRHIIYKSNVLQSSTYDPSDDMTM